MKKRICILSEGTDSFDIVLYLTKLLVTMRYRTIIIDFTKTKAICEVMEQCMDIDPNQDVINFRDINYTTKRISLEEEKEFEIIFEMYDKDSISLWTYKADLNIYVFNPYISCIKNLSKIINDINEEFSTKEIYILTNYVMDESLEVIKKETTSNHDILVIEYAPENIINACKCQLDKNVQFDKVSKSMKHILLKIFEELFPNDKKRSEKIYKHASKGENNRKGGFICL